MNANYINSRVANYQLCQVDPATGDVQALRRDWQADHEQFLVTPSMNRRREVAFVFFNEQQPGGLVVLPLKDISVSLDSIQQIAERNRGCVAPAWSPDDRWLAAVGNYPDDSGLFIATADLKQMYLVTLPPDGTQINKYTPSFSSDSDWITFSTSDGSVWVCDIAGNNLVRLTRPGKDSAPCWSR
jgi:Tol biopolymer transport system component